MLVVSVRNSMGPERPDRPLLVTEDVRQALNVARVAQDLGYNIKKLATIVYIHGLEVDIVYPTDKRASLLYTRRYEKGQWEELWDEEFKKLAEKAGVQMVV